VGRRPVGRGRGAGLRRRFDCARRGRDVAARARRRRDRAAHGRGRPGRPARATAGRAETGRNRRAAAAIARGFARVALAADPKPRRHRARVARAAGRVEARSRGAARTARRERLPAHAAGRASGRSVAARRDPRSVHVRERAAAAHRAVRRGDRVAAHVRPGRPAQRRDSQAGPSVAGVGRRWDRGRPGRAASQPRLGRGRVRARRAAADRGPRRRFAHPVGGARARARVRERDSRAAPGARCAEPAGRDRVRHALGASAGRRYARSAQGAARGDGGWHARRRAVPDRRGGAPLRHDPGRKRRRGRRRAARRLAGTRVPRAGAEAAGRQPPRALRHHRPARTDEAARAAQGARAAVVLRAQDRRPGRARGARAGPIRRAEARGARRRRGGAPAARLRRRGDAVRARVAHRSGAALHRHRLRVATARQDRLELVPAPQGEGRARDPRPRNRAARDPGTARAATAAAVGLGSRAREGDGRLVPVDRDGRPGHDGQRHRARPGGGSADGPAAVRRRRVRQDRAGDPRRVPSGDRRRAGRRSCAHDGARAAARGHVSRAAGRFPGRDRGSVAARDRQRGARVGRARRTRRNRHPDRHAPHPLGRRAFRAPGPRGRGRRAALRRHAEGALQEAACRDRPVDAVGHADPAHAAHVALGPARHLGADDPARGTAGDRDGARLLRGRRSDPRGAAAREESGRAGVRAAQPRALDRGVRTADPAARARELVRDRARSDEREGTQARHGRVHRRRRRRAGLDDDRRERHRHPRRRHDRDRPRRRVRTGRAAPTARPRRARHGEIALLPAGRAVEAAAPGSTRASEGPRGADASGLRLRDQHEGPRDPRRGQPARPRAIGPHRRGRLRHVLPSAAPDDREAALGRRGGRGRNPDRAGSAGRGARAGPARLSLRRMDPRPAHAHRGAARAERRPRRRRDECGAGLAARPFRTRAGRGARPRAALPTQGAARRDRRSPPAVAQRRLRARVRRPRRAGARPGPRGVEVRPIRTGMAHLPIPPEFQTGPRALEWFQRLLRTAPATPTMPRIR